jgi:hypothetical protein
MIHYVKVSLPYYILEIYIKYMLRNRLMASKPLQRCFSGVFRIAYSIYIVKSLICKDPSSYYH